MKRILVALLFLSSTAFAQDRDRNTPPNNIRNSFDRDHASPQGAQWQKNNRNWHANFRDNNNRKVDAYYDNRGNRIATHREIERTDIPRSVDMRVRDRFHTGDNYQVTRIERPNAQPLFGISLQLGSGSRTVYMDAQGRERQYHDPR